MKNLKYYISLLIIFIGVSCTVVFYDDINEHKGKVILKKEYKVIGSTIDAYDLYLIDTLGNYSTMRIRSELADLFVVGDTI